MNLYTYFLTQQGRPIIKNAHCFMVYERHFSRFVNRPVLMFEIGTGDGGSAQMWKGYFGPLARIVSIDIRDCQQYEESQIYIRTGSQSDSGFLRDLVAEFGPPDIVNDDGSHHMADIRASFDALYPLMASDGVYVVEDLNTAYWPELGGGFRSPGSFIEHCKDLIDELNAVHTRTIPESDFSRTTLSISFYDTIIVLEKTPYINRELLYLPAKP
jgi:cephalosporin hydroxylase